MVLLHPVEAGIIVVLHPDSYREAIGTRGTTNYGLNVMAACRVSKTDSLRSSRRARAKITGYAYSCNEIVNDTIL